MHCMTLISFFCPNAMKENFFSLHIHYRGFKKIIVSPSSHPLWQIIKMNVSTKLCRQTIVYRGKREEDATR